MSASPDHRTGRAALTARSFLRDTSGATAIEYGLIAGLLSIVIFSATASIGSRLVNIFDTVASKFP